jgi:hypothetical protein
MASGEDGHNPDFEQDKQSQRLRDRGAELLASATRHAQRLTDLAEKSGLLCDPPENLGSTVYETVLLQLELATSVAERTQRIADRVIDTLQRKVGHNSTALIDVEQGNTAHHRFLVCNDTSHAGKIFARVNEDAKMWAKVELTDDDLSVGEETAVYLVLDTSTLHANKPYFGRLTVSLGRTELLQRRFELWVRAKCEGK